MHAILWLDFLCVARRMTVQEVTAMLLMLKVAAEEGVQERGQAALQGHLLLSLCCLMGTACGSHLSGALLALLLAPLHKAVQVRKPHEHAALAQMCTHEAAATVV